MKTLVLVVLLLVYSLTVLAQPPTRTVTLNWVDTSNPAGTTYTVYRAPVTATLTYVKMAQNIAAKTWSESGVTPGVYRYYVTAVFNNAESLPSPTADADVKPYTVTLTVTVAE